MEQNMYNGELVVDDLVRELAVSRSVFFKKLKMLTGLAPIEFIKEIRIKRATPVSYTHLAILTTRKTDFTVMRVMSVAPNVGRIRSRGSRSTAQTIVGIDAESRESSVRQQ